jgi:hypothetical protein
MAARPQLGQSESVKTLIALAFLVAACSSSPLDASGTGTTFVDSCSAARAQQLGALATISTSTVQLLSDTAGVKTLYVDATAGGQEGVTTHPWIFIALSAAAKAAVNDVTSLQSLAWDLAFKRAQIYTNGGEGGPGKGASAFVDKDFANVTSADVASADFFSEKFFDDECNPIVDITGASTTSFSTWYNYDQVNHVLSPVPGTWLVKGATGKLFKLHFKSYYATPSGGTGSASGAYLLEIEAL